MLLYAWISEAYPQDQRNPHPGPCVIKDCWVEDREGGVGHTIVENVRAAIGHDKFRESFVDICGYRQVKNEALYRFCSFLSDGKFDLQGNTYQDSHLQPNSDVTRPHRPMLSDPTCVNRR